MLFTFDQGAAGDCIPIPSPADKKYGPALISVGLGRARGQIEASIDS